MRRDAALGIAQRRAVAQTNQREKLIQLAVAVDRQGPAPKRVERDGVFGDDRRKDDAHVAKTSLSITSIAGFGADPTDTLRFYTWLWQAVEVRGIGHGAQIRSATRHARSPDPENRRARPGARLRHRAAAAAGLARRRPGAAGFALSSAAPAREPRSPRRRLGRK